jgi:hypothetical protein
MATLCSIKIGYLSGGDYDQDAAWDVIKENIRYMQTVHHFWTPIRKELLAWHSPQDIAEAELQQYFDIYSADFGNPLEIHEEDHTVTISCSGGGPSRTHKEIVAMCVCETLVRKMRQYYVVPLSVTVT